MPLDTDDSAGVGKDGQVALISTADIDAFDAAAAGDLYGATSLTPADAVDHTSVFYTPTNPFQTTTLNGTRYEDILLVGEEDGTDGVKIFYVVDNPNIIDSGATASAGVTDLTPIASLVGMLEGININDLDPDNFDFN